MVYILLFLFVTANCGFAQHSVPEWSKGAVWYQIFPERFYNADTLNDPEVSKVLINSKKDTTGWRITPWTSDWFAESAWEKALSGNRREHLYERRYGGDIEGIIRKLEYLKRLGINGIYLNPVFEAVSLHKYDGSSFHHIDVNFGPDPDGDRKLIATENPHDPSTWVWTSADKLFLELIKKIHEKGMYIIIDGVFNHVGEQFWAFQDVVKNQKSSPYTDWFRIEKFDDPATPDKNEFDYKGWWGFKALPEFGRTETNLHPAVKEYIFASTQRWMDPNGDGKTEDGIDGWRLDVARDVPIGFWREWSPLVRKINQNALIIGELWELSPEFVSTEGIFDALMNYNFAYAVKDHFIAKKKKIKTTDFVKALQKIDSVYPVQNLYALQNLMTSHDTERLSSLIANPDREYDRDADYRNPEYNPGRPTHAVYEMQKMIAAFQMTYRGAPMIYYGDEVGMWGGDDPECRKPMVWEEFKYDPEEINAVSGYSKGWGLYTVEPNKDLYYTYMHLIRLRNNSMALKLGSQEFIYSNDKLSSFGFKREHGDEKYLIYFNLSEEQDIIEVPVTGKSVRDVYSGEKMTVRNNKLRFVLWGKSFAIFSVGKDN